jgi:hypothetical protein
LGLELGHTVSQISNLISLFSPSSVSVVSVWVKKAAPGWHFGVSGGISGSAYLLILIRGKGGERRSDREVGRLEVGGGRGAYRWLIRCGVVVFKWL